MGMSPDGIDLPAEELAAAAVAWELGADALRAAARLLDPVDAAGLSPRVAAAAAAFGAAWGDELAGCERRAWSCADGVRGVLADLAATDDALALRGFGGLAHALPSLLSGGALR
ncbi:hypothetical protein [Nocardioides sp. YIM 152588]|uniref:hypothetical protein n=1 Tax=Nocardioides sp. YIM 152588 TaxID=3158259 RepID=UPI0032E3BB1E